MKEIKGKVVLVGGGAKNLGGLLSRDFAENGAKAVVVHYHSDSSHEDAMDTVEAVKKAGADAIAIQADLTKPSENARIFDEANRELGGVDIAINTTGMVLKKPIAEISEEEYDKMFDVNAKAAFFFLKEAGDKVRDKGKIITIVTSLLAAYTGYYAVYPGAKSSIEHFTRAASKELGERGISVNAIGPGPMDTPFFYGQESEEAVAYHSSAAALSKFTKTGLTHIEDIAPIVRFLAGEGWWITGQCIFANGGYTTR
nr:SDR family oxidoreductase [Kangiella shandongensis]